MEPANEIENQEQIRSKIKDFSGRVDKALEFLQSQINQLQVQNTQNKAYLGNESYFEFDIKKYQACKKLLNELLTFIKEAQNVR